LPPRNFLIFVPLKDLRDAFCVARVPLDASDASAILPPTIWNKLLADILLGDSEYFFKSRLNTFLF